MSSFPGNVVDALKTSYSALSGIHATVTRPLRQTDPNSCIGIFSVDWTPGPYGIGQNDPTISTFLYHVQLLIKHTSEEAGRALHTDLSKQVRTMLYRDATLRSRLTGLSEVSGGVTERTQRFGVRRQNFLSNEVSGQFYFLSTTEVWVEVEAV